MIIDFHTHIFPDKIAASAVQKLSHTSHTVPFSDGTVVGLISSMQNSDVDHSVILPVATSPKQVPGINDSAACINETLGNKGIISFGGIHPDYENWKEELKRIADLGLKGIKIHPVYQRVNQDDIRYLRIMDYAGELGLIVLTHGGIDIGFPEMDCCSPHRILSAVKQIGPVKLVAAHMGGWKEWNEAEELLAETDVLLDTSFSTGVLSPLDDDFYSPEYLKMLSTEQFIRLAHTFGTDRILFGTDSPWSSQSDSIAWIRELPLDQTEKEAILGGNARRLLGL